MDLCWWYISKPKIWETNPKRAIIPTCILLCVKGRPYKTPKLKPHWVTHLGPACSFVLSLYVWTWFWSSTKAEKEAEKAGRQEMEMPLKLELKPARAKSETEGRPGPWRTRRISPLLGSVELQFVPGVKLWSPIFWMVLPFLRLFAEANASFSCVQRPLFSGQTRCMLFNQTHFVSF